MSASTCRVTCRLHTKFGYHEPCRFCGPSHALPASRSGDQRSPARVADPRIEVPDRRGSSVGRAPLSRIGTAEVAGSTPALGTGTSPVRLARTNDQTRFPLGRSSEGPDGPASPAEREAKPRLGRPRPGPSPVPALASAGRPRARGVHAGTTSLELRAERLTSGDPSSSTPAPLGALWRSGRRTA